MSNIRYEPSAPKETDRVTGIPQDVEPADIAWYRWQYNTERSPTWKNESNRAGNHSSTLRELRWSASSKVSFRLTWGLRDGTVVRADKAVGPGWRESYFHSEDPGKPRTTKRTLNCPYGRNFRHYLPGWGYVFTMDVNGGATVQMSGTTYSGNVREVENKKDGDEWLLILEKGEGGDRLECKVVLAGGDNPGDAKKVSPHPDYEPRTYDGTRLNQLTKGGKVVNKKIKAPMNVTGEAVPGGWIFGWDKATVPYNDCKAQVWKRPTDERGSGRCWTTQLWDKANGGINSGWRAVDPCAVPGRLWDIRVQFTSLRYGPGELSDIIVVRSEPGVSAGMQPPRIYLQHDEDYPPLDDQDLEEVATSFDEMEVPLSIQAQKAGKVVDRAEMYTILGGRTGMNLLIVDSTYRAVPVPLLMQFLKEDEVDTWKYNVESWDCDNFAMALAVRAARALGNCCGIVMDGEARHAYNVFLTLDDEGEPDLTLVEPQSDRIVTVGEEVGDIHYKFQQGYIIWG